ILSPRLAILYHDLRHSKASIACGLSLFLLSVTVSFAVENRRSGDADIAGIDNKSSAILLKLGYSKRRLVSDHHFLASKEMPVRRSILWELQYLTYSSSSSVLSRFDSIHISKSVNSRSAAIPIEPSNASGSF